MTKTQHVEDPAGEAILIEETGLGPLIASQSWHLNSGRVDTQSGLLRTSVRSGFNSRM